MMKALNETEKLKSSSETYKKDQLISRLAEKESDLQQARDQAAGLVSDNDGETHWNFLLLKHSQNIRALF